MSYASMERSRPDNPKSPIFVACAPHGLENIVYENRREGFTILRVFPRCTHDFTVSDVPSVYTLKPYLC